MRGHHFIGVICLLLAALTPNVACIAAAPPDFKPAADAWVGRGGAVANSDGSWERFYSGAKHLLHVTSRDNGATWSEPRPLR